MHPEGSSQLFLSVLLTSEDPHMTPSSMGIYFTFISLGHLNKQNECSLHEVFLLKFFPKT